MATSGGIPVPHPKDMKRHLVNSWEFFKEPWTNYEIATELDTKNGKITVATLLATMGKEVLQIYCHLPMTKEERKNPQGIIKKLEAYFKPKKKCNLRKICVLLT